MVAIIDASKIDCAQMIEVGVSIDAIRDTNSASYL